MSTPIDELIRTRRKSITIIVQRDGRVTVRAPLRVSEGDIRRFVESKATWIHSKQAWVKTHLPAPKPKQYVDGDNFWYLGELHQLSIVDERIPLLNLNGSFYLSLRALPRAKKIFTEWYRRQAGEILSERVAWYAKKYGFTYQQVKITSARTRWGSCSGRGTISFPWRLVMAPVPVIDYVVLHELVHTQVKNHSKVFWAKVGLLVPEYKQHKKWLQKNGNLLTLD